MKAAIWKDISSIQIKHLPIPKPRQPFDVVIRVLGCGVCVADSYILRGEVPLAKPPVVLGHEIFGEVYKLGDGVDHLRIGEMVCIDPMITCGKCFFCRHGKPNLCGSMQSVGFRLDGGFQQFALVPISHVHPVSPIGKKAGVLAQPLACVLHGYDKLNLGLGSDVMILGAGSTGLLWTQLMKNSMKGNLIQTEIIESRRNLALQLGADFAINPQHENLAKKVREIAPEGVDIIIDATGSSQAIQESLPSLKKGGTLMIFGICCPGENLIVPAYDMFENEWKIIGSKMLPHKMNTAVRILESGLIESEKIVTQALGLNEIEEGLEWVLKEPGKAIKFFVDPWIDE